MSGSADREPKPPQRLQVAGPYWLYSFSFHRPWDSEYLHFSSSPCLLLQRLSGTFREGGQGREHLQFKLTFSLCQSLRKPLLHTYFCQQLSFINSLKQRIRAAFSSRHLLRLGRSNAGRQLDRAECLGFMSQFYHLLTMTSGK